MMIAIIILLGLILVFEIALLCVISAKELSVDERKCELREDRKRGESMSNPYDTAEKSVTAEDIMREKQKREYEDYMHDVDILNRFGNDDESQE